MRHGIEGSDAALPRQMAPRRITPARSANRTSVASTLRRRSSRGDKGFVVTAFIAFVFGLLLIVNTLTQMGEDAYSIGRASIVVTLILPQLILVISRPRGLRRRRHLAAPVACFVFLSLLYYPRGVDSDDNWIPLLQVVLLGGFFTSVATFSWSSQALMLLNWIARGFIFASLLYWAWMQLPIPNYGPYINPNANGAALAYLFGLSLLSVRHGAAFDIEKLPYRMGVLGPVGNSVDRVSRVDIGSTGEHCGLHFLAAGMPPALDLHCYVLALRWCWLPRLQRFVPCFWNKHTRLDSAHGPVT